MARAWACWGCSRWPGARSPAAAAASIPTTASTRCACWRSAASRSRPRRERRRRSTPGSIRLLGHDVTSYAWSWCPVATAPGAPCPISEDQASTLAGMPVSFTLPTAADGTTTTFTNNFPPALFDTLCAGSAAIPATDCSDGYPIQLQLTVTTDDDQVQAVRPHAAVRSATRHPATRTRTPRSWAFSRPSARRRPHPFDGDPPCEPCRRCRATWRR